MQSVANKTNTTSARPGSAWRPDAFRDASPSLQVIIEACRALDTQVARARRSVDPLRERANKLEATCLPTNSEISAAMDAVPVPEILLVPVTSPYAVGLLMSDGTERPFDIDRGDRRVLYDDADIQAHYADDPAILALALTAQTSWLKERSRAAGALHATRRQTNPDYTGARSEADTARDQLLAPALVQQRAGYKALAAFEASNGQDRLAQALALLEHGGARISGKGVVRGFLPAFESDGGARLAELLVAALAAAADEVVTPYDPTSEDAAVLTLVTEFEKLGGKILLYDGDSGTGVWRSARCGVGDRRRHEELVSGLNADGLQDALVRVLAATGRVITDETDGEAMAPAPDYDRELA
jgi:hypothetical protein